MKSDIFFIMMVIYENDGVSSPETICLFKAYSG